MSRFAFTVVLLACLAGCVSTRSNESAGAGEIEVEALVYWWEGVVGCEVKEPAHYRKAQFSIDGVSEREIPTDSIGRWRVYLPASYEKPLLRQMSYFAAIDDAIERGMNPANISDSWMKFRVEWKTMKRKPEKIQRQPNQALQTTPMTRSEI